LLDEGTEGRALWLALVAVACAEGAVAVGYSRVATPGSVMAESKTPCRNLPGSGKS
jgi:hypothetical protein